MSGSRWDPPFLHDASCSSTRKPPPLSVPQRLRQERTLLAVPALKIVRGVSYDIESTPTFDRCAVVGFGCNWSGRFAVAESVRVGPKMIFSYAALSGNYNLRDDFPSIVAGCAAKPPFLMGGQRITLRARFDWPEKAWMQSGHEFRCWWIVEVM